ncbi:hypothetical protein BY458DRAFT_515724 [Sporodiniella umbellata]|nr:hypothetical protein BY458DRAFT_515724 [Sporodiniella umbellata]
MSSSSWITIYKNTPSAKVVFVSDSITEVCGWEPNEIIDQLGSRLFHPDDLKSLIKIHTVNIVKERMASLVIYRFLRKDGSFVVLESVINYCYDLLITSNYLYENDTLEHGLRTSTVDEIFICRPTGQLQLAGAWNERQENILKIIETNQVWKEDKLVMPLEKRFCLVLNRFTESLSIVYATQCIKELVSISSEDVIGQSFFSFVHKQDIPSLRAQIEMAKEHGSVVRLRFDWLIDQNTLEPVEGIVNGTYDGISLVIRLSPRFIN